MNALNGPLLIVEDTPDTLNLLKVTLEFKGYRVVTARNGREALDAIQKERPAVIITDILMPQMDGFSLVQRLRINPETRDIPVVFLSATYVAPEDKQFAMTLGASRFIEKPIDTDELLKTIAELFAKGAPKTSPPLEERKFYEGYKERLEIKLQQKVIQISRTERLLETLSEEEKPPFKTDLRQAISEREEIEQELDQIRKFLKQNTLST
ncbi:MAG: response regulator [Chloroflexi bacterium]|nr:response regulator [Chloroflexota bacterium]